MSDLVGNPKDRFSHNEAHIRLFYCHFLIVQRETNSSRSLKIFRGAVHNFKHLLQNHLTTQSGASMDRGKKSLFTASGTHDQDGPYTVIAQLISAFIIVINREYNQNFEPLTIFCGCTAMFVSVLVRKVFSHRGSLFKPIITCNLFGNVNFCHGTLCMTAVVLREHNYVIIFFSTKPEYFDFSLLPHLILKHTIKDIEIRRL